MNMNYRIWVTVGWIGLAWRAAVGAPFAQFEARQTHPIDLSPSRTRLLAVNSPESRLSVFAVGGADDPAPVLVAEIPVGLEPVSVRARTDDEVWVVNEVSDGISIVSLSAGVVVATLPCADEPADVVFAGEGNGRAFVSCARNSVVRVFDVAMRQELGSVSLLGQGPRALEVSGDGSRIFAAFQLSGNGTTVLRAGLAPLPPVPENPELPAAPSTALIVAADDPRIVYRVLDHDVAEIDAGTLAVQRYHTNVGTSLFALAARPGSAELWVANTEARNLTRFEAALKGRFIDNRLTRLDPATGGTSIVDLNGPAADLRPANASASSLALAQPAALVFTPGGESLWVAAFASDRVARVSAVDGVVVSRVDVRLPAPSGGPNDSRRMRGPRGLALHAGRQRLYVLNKIASSISVIDTAAEAVVAEVPIGSVSTVPAAVKEGRGFLFDARLSGNGSAACGSCHLDADRDGLAWDLGNPAGDMAVVMGADLATHDPTPVPRPMHPMKGPMVTQTLRGLSTNQLLHWRGDRASLREFNPTFRDLLGGGLIADADVDALGAYLFSLRHHPNPNRARDNSVPATLNGGSPARGQTLFAAHFNHCGICHVLPSGSDNNVDDLRNIGAAQPIKTPTLQTVYQRAFLDTRPGATNVAGFGLLHDGTGGRQALPTVHFYELDGLTGSGFADVASFVLCFDTGVAPAVGFGFTVTSANRSDPAVLAAWALLEAQAELTNRCDLVVHGRVQGERKSFQYDSVTRALRSSRSADGLILRTDLLAQLRPDDALTVQGVLPGAGPRLSIDRDGDGAPDDDRPGPELRWSRVDGRWRLHWPGGSAPWALEESSSLVGPWAAAAMVRHDDPEGSWVEFPELNRPETFFRLRRVW